MISWMIDAGCMIDSIFMERYVFLSFFLFFLFFLGFFLFGRSGIGEKSEEEGRGLRRVMVIELSQASR